MGSFLNFWEQAKKTPPSGEANNPLNFWWTSNGVEKGKEATPKQKLLGDDFQVMQAYNYLKAWRVMDQFQQDSVKADAQSVTPTSPEGEKKTK